MEHIEKQMMEEWRGIAYSIVAGLNAGYHHHKVSDAERELLVANCRRSRELLEAVFQDIHARKGRNPHKLDLDELSGEQIVLLQILREHVDAFFKRRGFSPSLDHIRGISAFVDDVVEGSLESGGASRREALEEWTLMFFKELMEFLHHKTAHGELLPSLGHANG